MSNATEAESPEGAGAEPPEASSRRRWLILLVGLVAMTAGCTFQYGMSYWSDSQKITLKALSWG